MDSMICCTALLVGTESLIYRPRTWCRLSRLISFPGYVELPWAIDISKIPTHLHHPWHLDEEGHAYFIVIHKIHGKENPLSFSQIRLMGWPSHLGMLQVRTKLT